MTTMIALVGDQPLPNFLAIKHFHYDKVLLVYTDERDMQYRYLREVPEKKLKVEVKHVRTEARNSPGPQDLPNGSKASKVRV